MDVSITALRGFLAVSEELHFGRAASGLFLTTSALSQMIARLERQLGVVLFERSARHVALAPAGLEMVAYAREVVSSHNRLVSWAARYDQRKLRIGFTQVGPSRILADVFAAVTSVPTMTIEYRHVLREDIPSLLTQGEIDVAFLWGPLDVDGVRTHTLGMEPRSILVNDRSALAALDEATLDEIDEPMIVPVSPDRAFMQWALVDPRPDGSAVLRGPEARDLDEALALVAIGQGVHLVPRCVAESVNHSGVRAVPVRGVPDFPYLLAHRNSDLPTLTENFVTMTTGVVLTGNLANTALRP